MASKSSWKRGHQEEISQGRRGERWRKVGMAKRHGSTFGLVSSSLSSPSRRAPAERGCPEPVQAPPQMQHVSSRDNQGGLPARRQLHYEWMERRLARLGDCKCPSPELLFCRLLARSTLAGGGGESREDGIGIPRETSPPRPWSKDGNGSWRQTQSKAAGSPAQRTLGPPTKPGVHWHLQFAASR